MRVGIVAPHAPLLLPQLTGPETRSASERVRDALRRIDLGGVDLVVLVSPHGHATGVYRQLRGSLAELGPRGIEMERTADADAARALAAAWGHPLLPEPVDHGVVVPLLLGGFDAVPTIAVSVRDATGGDEDDLYAALEEARALASAVCSLDGRVVALVASLNTSIALTPRAPLMRRDEACAVEAEVLKALERDVSSVEDLALDLWRAGRSCGAAPLVTLARVCGSRAAYTLAYEVPVGVGYLVATTGTS